MLLPFALSLRCIGLLRATLQLHLKAATHNIRRLCCLKTRLKVGICVLTGVYAPKIARLSRSSVKKPFY